MMGRAVAVLLSAFLSKGHIDQVVPHMADCKGTADQLWHISFAASMQTASQITKPARADLKLVKGGCLLPGLVAGTNTAFIGKCGGSQWIVHKDKTSSTNVWFEAAASPGECLGLHPHVWPVPSGRNYLVQLTHCPGTKWTHHSSASSVFDQPPPGSLVFDNHCLDGGLGSGAPPPAPKCCEQAPVASLPFCDKSTAFVDRAIDLEARLTVDEIAGLLSMSMPGGETPVGTTYINQRLTAPVDRLHIPAFQFSEACHGILSGCLRGTENSSGCPTSFPMPIGQAAAFNETLWRAVATAIADEARALHSAGAITGINFFAPNINVVRDPRWGRGYETAGEDALVNARFATQFVLGLQGERTTGNSYLKTLATCKHSLLYDVEKGRGANSLSAPARDLTDYYLLPFEHCIKRANVSAIMCQYGAMDGIPSCANSKINNGVYREQYGWTGYLVSDCDAVGDFNKFPKINVSTQPEAVAAGVLGGLDVDCGESYSAIPTAVRMGILPEAALRAAARRFLTTQFALGAFEPTSWDRVPASVVDSAAHRALALDAAQQSLVLLKNSPHHNHTVLPVSKSARLALIGPHAGSTNALLGNYHGVNLLVQKASIAAAATARGLNYSASQGLKNGSLTERDPKALAESVRLAAAADVAVLFLGLDENMEGEGHDRKTLELPPAQIELASKVYAAQPRTVLVLVNGGALAVESLLAGPNATMPSAMEAFYPGQAGAEAIVQALIGETNRFGRLPYTMYPAQFVGRSMLNFDLRADGGLTYRYYDGRTHGTPLFWFGHGLSYTTFKFAWAGASPTTVAVSDLGTDGDGCYDCSRIRFAVTVTNTGPIAGETPVLAFIENGSGRALFDFGRVDLAAGSSATVWLAMDRGCAQAVTTVDADGVRWIQPGNFTVRVGDVSSPTTHTLVVTGARTMVSPKCR